ncbi:3-hydroxy-3-methylglutaryl-CoA reductase [candidate division MSBL1 archaeon SCGC-AAA382K21]|uniref:3-hydroxy-3-methylglutaryl coenzyme A reductase n=1 Tax=candidate division MSBL1 archaeon SCGC-AAA382K21 TaxID=1698283 RepID=A0A133VKM4_9EURY|nr:3-hydroxy-3-methylglutaryl-CoA reductase [candidate division MSBL1 archaeon SCGC-AAA382K21]
MEKSSRISGFYKLSPRERLEKVKEFSNLSKEEVEILREAGALKIEQGDKMIENVVSSLELPLGIAVNFLINEKDYLIPMATEESSVVAAASNAAKMARSKGGFKAESNPPHMIGQIQVTDLEDTEQAKKEIESKKEEILKLANQQDQMLIELGGGAKDLEVRKIETESGRMLIIHLIIDTRDAMGANIVNTMCEAVAPLIEEATNGRVFLRIISNLADKRIARAKAVFDKDKLGGEKAVEGILKAYHFAAADPYRGATHNKGIMNGIDAVALATGNDTRALEAGAHSYAALGGEYKPLTTWKKDEGGNLVGEIEIPISAGIIGGSTQINPIAKTCLKILSVDSSQELAEVMAAVGLAQNLAALRALSAEGIQKGHMRLHARNIASLVGAEDEILEEIAGQMVSEENISTDRAKELIEEFRKK